MIEYINVLKSLKNLYIFDINLIKGGAWYDVKIMI